jgi:geranylgeranyl pyrophosphate synthase
MIESPPLLDFVARSRAEIDAALDHWLPSAPRCPALVCEAMRYSVFAGGKRLRPILALAAADAVARDQRSTDRRRGGATNALAMPLACAAELIHTYSLVHDDLPAMDNDSLRRGRPTLHVVYGDGIAILAGDALQAEAFALLAREPVSEAPDIAARKLRTLRLVADASGAAGMVGGQAIDLQAAGQVARHHATLDADGLKAMHGQKTGALIRASAVGGALMAGANEALLSSVDEYASELGLAFQIVDDILDVEGEVAALGKSVGKDADHDKPTYPSLFGMDRSRQMARACVERARAALARAEIEDSWLGLLADYVITRKT